MKRLLELILISTLFCLVTYIYKDQSRVIHNNGQGWDGRIYYSMTEQIQQNRFPITEELPFIKRIGTPFLTVICSNLTGKNLLDSALYVDLIATFFTVLFLYVWLSLFIKEFWIKTLLSLLFMLSWISPLRFSLFYPVTSDAWATTSLLASLLVLHLIQKALIKKNTHLLIIFFILFSITVTVGNLFRESLLALVILPVFILHPLDKFSFNINNIRIKHIVEYFKNMLSKFFTKKSLLLLIPVFFIISTNLYISRFISIKPTSYSYPFAILEWFYKKSIPEYFTGIFIAFGPLVLLLPLFCTHYKSLLWQRQELLSWLAIAILSGYIGGGDTERITFMSSFPIYFIILGISIRELSKSSKKWWLFVLLLLQTIAYRIFLTIPNYPIENPNTPIPFFGLIGNNFSHLYLYSHHGHFLLNSILFIEYAALFIITWFVIRHKSEIITDTSKTQKTKKIIKF